MRLFVAVDLPGNIREVLTRGMSHLKKDLPGARWVRAEGIHITLKFLGEQSEQLVGDLDREVAPALASLSPVRIQLAGGGFFPHDKRPRVAWVGGQADGLDRWATVIEEAATSLGVEREKRPFSLHLTLARLERPWPPRATEHFTLNVGKWHFPEFVAGEAVLFRSELKPSGAVYTPLLRWKVGGA